MITVGSPLAMVVVPPCPLRGQVTGSPTRAMRFPPVSEVALPPTTVPP